jgi:hypothetical protein
MSTEGGPSFIIVPRGVAQAADIGMTEKMVLSLVLGLTIRRVKNETVARFLGIKENSAAKSMVKLRKLGYLNDREPTMKALAMKANHGQPSNQPWTTVHQTMDNCPTYSKDRNIIPIQAAMPQRELLTKEKAWQVVAETGIDFHPAEVDLYLSKANGLDVKEPVAYFRKIVNDFR